MSTYFDYQTLAGRLEVTSEDLARLEAVVRQQYGSDQMMYELRMLRTLRAVERGTTTISGALSDFGSSQQQGRASGE